MEVSPKRNQEGKLEDARVFVKLVNECNAVDQSVLVSVTCIFWSL